MRGQCDGSMLKMSEIIRTNGLCCLCHDILSDSKKHCSTTISIVKPSNEKNFVVAMVSVQSLKFSFKGVKSVKLWCTDVTLLSISESTELIVATLGFPTSQQTPRYLHLRTRTHHYL